MIYINKNFIKIETQNLLLLDSLPQNWPAIKNFFENIDPELVRYSAWQDLYRKDTQEVFESTLKYQFDNPRDKFVLGILAKNDIKIVYGLCSLFLLKNNDMFGCISHRQAVLRFFLSKNGQGCFYSLEVLEALLRFGFEYLGLSRIVMYVDPDNIGLGKVLNRAGFRQEVCSRSSLYYDSGWHDQFIYAILKKEWCSGKLK